MGVYVHIPFCEKKCYYCDFHSVVVGNQGAFAQITDSYLVSLRQEALYYRSAWGEEPLFSLFFGGGTPSVLPAQKLSAFISFLRAELPFVKTPEITVEANPHSLNLEGAEILAAAGVNRVSLGVQAFQDNLLQAIGRLHRVEHIAESVSNLRRAGIHDINLDLMFGLPGQSMDQWLETLESAVQLAPTHLSCYGLILESDTPFANWYKAGLLELPNDDQQADMYQLTRSFLKQAGFEHYEISNYCRSGYQSQHNLLYWRNRRFIGLGSGATGYIQNQRYTNVADIKTYISSWKQGIPPYQEHDPVSVEQEMDETMMVGMRLLAGVSEQEFSQRFQVSYWDVYESEIKDLLSKGLVEFIDGHLRVTEEGLLLENLVSGAFLR